MLPLVLTAGRATEQVACKPDTALNLLHSNSKSFIFFTALNQLIRWGVNQCCGSQWWNGFWNQPQTAPNSNSPQSSWGCSHCLTAVVAASLHSNTKTADKCADCQRLKIICLHLPHPAPLLKAKTCSFYSLFCFKKINLFGLKQHYQWKLSLLQCKDIDIKT